MGRASIEVLMQLMIVAFMIKDGPPFDVLKDSCLVRLSQAKSIVFDHIEWEDCAVFKCLCQSLPRSSGDNVAADPGNLVGRGGCRGVLFLPPPSATTLTR